MVNTKQTERTHTDNAVRYGTEVSDRKETEMGKTFVEDERPCDSCVNATRYGCVSWNCEYINRDEAIKAWREKHETADRKTEPQIEKCPFDDSLPCGWVCTEYGKCKYKPKTEPQTMYYPQVDGITPSVIVKTEPQKEE